MCLVNEDCEVSKMNVSRNPRRVCTMPLALVIALSCVLALSGCLKVSAPYAVSGIVKDALHGQGVGGVTISFSGGFTPVVTASDGTWAKPGLKGIVTMTPSLPGAVFSPSSRTVNNATSTVNVTAAPILESVYWYSVEDEGGFSGGSSPVEPTEELTSVYSVTVENSTVQTAVPQGYDVLVISDTGASFDISDFEGSVIVTFDSGISPLFHYLTGSTQEEVYWDYDSGEELTWVNPITATELGAEGDARVYHTLSGLSGFTRRNDLLEAGSTDDADDIIVYEVVSGEKAWWWVHIGPHFGDYPDDPTVTDVRVSEIICYILRVLNFGSPDFPEPPVSSDGAGLCGKTSRNK